jgi:subtilase-type serine protease
MKPKYKNIIRKALPVLIVIPAMSQMANAAAISTQPNGSLIVTVADSGANHIVVNGGVSPIVEINAGTSLTADGVFDGITVTSAGYFDPAFNPANPTALTTILGIRNDGSINAGDDGLNAGGNKITFYNTGSLVGADELINNLGNASVIANSGTLNGEDGGIVSLNADNVVVHNTGSINGDSDFASAGAGIELRDGASIVNSGTILGGSGGVYLRNDGNITNNRAGSIIGNNSGSGNGINFGNDTTALNTTVDISNYGIVTGNTGINVGSNVTIHNLTSFQSFWPFAAIDGGDITGTVGNGITATTNLTMLNQNLSTVVGAVNGIAATDFANITNSFTITGNNGDGIRALDNGTVTNNLGGTITGTNGTGVWLDDSATVTNHGTITGTNSGVRVSEGSTVTNTGTIRGATGIDAFGSGSFFNLTNSGIITGTGGTAIDGILGGGVDTYLFNAGSLVTGNIFLRSGNDAITMTSSGSASSVVLGNIDGGSGTDTLNFVNGMTSVGGFTNRVSGNVSFMEDINKSGNGTAFVIGNVNSDTIDVTGGALYIVGNVDGTNNPQTAISANTAEIGGTGTWDANITLTNTALISPGQINLPIASPVANSVGTLNVAGDVSLDINSKYIWNAIPTPNTPLVAGITSDLIRLTGKGNQFSTNVSDFVIAPTNVNTPLLTGSTIVVDTDEPLIGNFWSVIKVGAFPSTTPDNGPFFANQINPILAANFSTLTKVNNSQDWQLNIVHNYSQFGSTPNEVAAGNMLDGLVNTATGNVADLLAALDYSNAQTTEDTLAALDPGSFLASAAGLASNNYRLHRTVENHNAAVRAGSGSVSMPAASSAKGAVAPVASGCAGTSNVWGSFSYDWQDLNTGNRAFDQNGETAAFTAGIDFTVTNNLRLGLVAEGSQTSWDGNGNLGSDIDSYRFAGYANWGAATGWYVDALLGYNTNSVDQSRLVSMGNNLGVQSGGYDADGWQGMITVGNTIATSAGMFSPFIGLEWQQLSADSFTATGSPLPIGVSSFDIDSIRGLIGVKWETEIAQNMKAYASLAYAYEFQGDAPTTTVSFGGGSYRAIGQDLGDSVLLSAGMRWNVTDCTTVDFGYRGEFAMDDGIDSNGANIGVNYSF